MTGGVVEPLQRTLDAVRGREDLRARRSADPIEVVHRYRDRDDRELVALLAATCAFGNVKAIRAKLDDALARVGPRPSIAADDPKDLHGRLRGWKHRLFLGEDVARLLIGARRVQRVHGSLGEAFRADLETVDAAQPAAPASERLREALAIFCERVRREGGLPLPGESDPRGRRGPAHMLSDPRAGSAAKRLLLFLRWVIRPDDGIDLGMWPVPPGRLLIPVDVHIHKLGRNLGLTRRKDVSWKTAVEITEALARFDPSDPTRYDFALCHLGMVQRCPSRRDAARCEGCGVKPVCVHWRPRKLPGARARTRSA